MTETLSTGSASRTAAGTHVAAGKPGPAPRARSIQDPTATSAIEVRGICASRGGRPVLTDVDLDFGYGGLHIIIGPNGAGKSTLFDVLGSTLRPESGQVRLAGCDLGDYSIAEAARTRAVMTQSSEVAFSFTVAEVVAMSQQTRGRRDPEAVRRALDLVDMGRYADSDITCLSGGEKARAAFARTLAQGTDVLLLDEPVAALDIHHQENLLAICRGLVDDGACIVMILHDLDLAFACADTVTIIDAGLVRASGSVDAVCDAGLLSEVYGHPIEVLTHPDTGRPIVLPRRGRR